MRMNHLQDRILVETETSKQTIGRHGWIFTCIGELHDTAGRVLLFFQPQRERAMCIWMKCWHILWFLSCVTIYPKETVFCNRMVLGHIQLESHNSLLQKTTSAYCNWTSLSPDVSSIEHVWDELKRRVYVRPDPPVNGQQLKYAVIEEWNAIPQPLRPTLFNLCATVV